MPFPRKRPHDVQHLAHHLRVQRGGGLVEQQHLRVHGQRPGNGHPLLLAAGDLPGLGVDVGRHAHLFQIVSCACARASSRLRFSTLHLADHAVFQHRHIVEQIEGLEHHAHMGAVGRRVDAPPGDVLAVVAESRRQVGVSSRLMHRSSVDLPEPEAPMMEVTSPLATVKSMSRSTSWLPKDLERCVTCKITSVHINLLLSVVPESDTRRLRSSKGVPAAGVV